MLNLANWYLIQHKYIHYDVTALHFAKLKFETVDRTQIYNTSFYNLIHLSIISLCHFFLAAHFIINVSNQIETLYFHLPATPRPPQRKANIYAQLISHT